MEPVTAQATPGEEQFAECFISSFPSELGLSPAFGRSSTLFMDPLELPRRLGDLGNIVCWNDHIDHRISYLNKELVTLGLPQLYKEDGSGESIEHSFDLLALINSTCSLLNLYQEASAKLCDMEAEEIRRAGELDYLRTRHGKLKEQVEACEKEIAAVQSKEQQLQSKNKQLSSMLKGEKDEIAKLLTALENQKNHHTHEMKRKEQELFRLKGKMSQLVTEKKDKKGTIEILNVLPRADGKRGTWKTGKSLARKEEELFRIQLSKQERREQELAIENAKLKQVLNQVGQDVEQLLGTDASMAQGTEENCAYKAFLRQWCSLMNSIKTLHGQVLDVADAHMSESGGQNPVISVTDHDKEIMKLKEEIEESRVLIALQQQCFQEQLNAANSSELPAHLKGSYFLEEQQRLQEEREMFREQKKAFELERKNFTEAAIRLGWERQQFEEEKAQFLKREFLHSLPRMGTTETTRRLSAPVVILGENVQQEQQTKAESAAQLPLAAASHVMHASSRTIDVLQLFLRKLQTYLESRQCIMVSQQMSIHPHYGPGSNLPAPLSQRPFSLLIAHQWMSSEENYVPLAPKVTPNAGNSCFSWTAAPHLFHILLKRKNATKTQLVKQKYRKKRYSRMTFWINFWTAFSKNA